ncbi:MAG: hypothetical protein R3C19_21005 [Planctomycetaceae bacterium]
MKITAACPSCEKTLSVGAEHAGKKIRCPACKSVVQLPQVARPAAAVSRAGSATTGGERRSSRVASGANTGGQSAKPRRPRTAGRPATDGKRRPRQAAAITPDNIWNQPLSSYSSPAIPEEEYEAYGIENRPRRRGPGGRLVGDDWEPDPPEETYAPVLIFCLLFGVIGIVGGVLTFSVPDAGRILSFISLIPLALASAFQHWRIIGNAYEESTLCGFLCWAFGPYFLYYLVTRWDENRKPFLKSLVCEMSLIAPTVGVVVTGGFG